MAHQRNALGRFQIDGEAFFVAIDAKKVGAFAAGERWTPAARIVADAGLFHFDHLSAEVAEEHRAVRASENARQIEHADAGEGSCVEFAHGS